MTRTAIKTAAIQQPSSISTAEDRLARLAGVLPRSFGNVRVLLVGAGSVGSLLADGLARAGIGHFAIIDPDLVEPANLSRTVYRASDVGKSKVESLAAHLTALDPAIEIEAIASKLQDTNKTGLKRIMAATDMIVCAADDVAAQVLLNRMSQAYRKPALFVGIYARAAGGEAALSIPGPSACFECFIGGVRTENGSQNGAERKINYGTGRLEGEVALGSDIQHVTSGALKLALALLSALSGDREEKASAFIMPLLASRQTAVMFGMEPGFHIFPDVLRGAYGQYAFQSLWLTVHRKDNCPACSGLVMQDPIEAMTASVTKETGQNIRDQIAGMTKE